jgi:hypothetical protein
MEELSTEPATSLPSRPAANSLFGLFTSSLCVRSGKTVSWPETWS